MKFTYSISILRKAAFEIGGEILTDLSDKEALNNSDDITKLAYQVLFGGLLERTKSEKVELFLELIKAINLLKNSDESGS